MVPAPTNIALPSDVLPPGSNSNTAVPLGSRTDPEPPPRSEGSLYLKQEGKVYLVRDRETLGRWIQESRVGAEDLVSEGGVRWEPISARAELRGSFAAEESAKTPLNPEPPPIAVPSPFPFGGETPFADPNGGAPGRELRDALDLEGIPVGLPPLPTIDVVKTGATASSATEAPTERWVSEPAAASSQPGSAPGTSSKPDASLGTSGAPSGDDLHLASDLFGELPTEENLYTGGDTWEVPNTSRGPLVVAFVATLLIVVAIIAYLLWPPSTPQKSEPDLGSILPSEPVEQPAPVAPEPGAEPAGTEAAAAAETPADEAAAEPEPSAEPEPGGTASAEPAPAPEPEGAASAEPVPSSAPPPSPEPAPSPAPAPTRSVAELVDAGWSQGDAGDYAAAARTFRQAVAQDPSSADAHYGLGYALVETGHASDAIPHLCEARAKGDLETRREAGGILEKNHLTCP